MPTIAKVHGLRFSIFVNDHPPPHVHVGGRGAAQIGILDPQPVLAVQGMSKADVARARDVVRAERQYFTEVWKSIHG